MIQIQFCFTKTSFFQVFVGRKANQNDDNTRSEFQCGFISRNYGLQSSLIAFAWFTILFILFLFLFFLVSSQVELFISSDKGLIICKFHSFFINVWRLFLSRANNFKWICVDNIVFWNRFWNCMLNFSPDVCNLKYKKNIRNMFDGD